MKRLLAACVALSTASLAGQAPENISINDNRTAAGVPSGAVLTLNLEARLGTWHPDGDSNPGVVVKAFGVEGGPLQIPGPAIRVREGTRIKVRIHNRLADSLAVHGLYTRPKAPSPADTLVVGAGETREVDFDAGAAGTYFYWGAPSAEAPMPGRKGPDSQLVGAIVIDPAAGPPPDDRVLLVSNWPSPQPATLGRMVINGRSWPHTERLAYNVGDTVRMRLINVGGAVHPMHLHGFYYRIDSRGDEGADTIYRGDASPRMVVTERLAAGRTFTLTWKPTRPGNWLFHCHDNNHLARGVPLDGSAPAPPPHHVENHALEVMSGPVMGITVRGRSSEPAPASGPRRQLRLVARVDRGGTEQEPSYGYTLHTGPTTVVPQPPYLPGPTIVLKRGEPVSITVTNELPEPTAVHWHGIELESYYDGVAGFSGDGTRVSPAIPPGGSFEARFTPPRSGTFIYHTHVDEPRQQQAGLSGALIVVDDPAAYDPSRDFVMLVTTPRTDAEGATLVLLNGLATPPERELQAGVPVRLRFINAHTARPSMRMRILRDSALLEWKALAKDGRDLPADQAIAGPSEVQMGNGETYDFEFVPSAGPLRFEITTGAGVLLLSMPLRVR